jgi:protein ImuA
MNIAPPPADRLAALRARIRALEGRPGELERPPVRLGPAVDPLLPGDGLCRPALHELAGPAATLFALAIAKAALDRPGLFLWCLDEATVAARGIPWPPGLAARGLDPGRLVLVRTPDARATAWAMEEALSNPAVAVVVGELARADLGLGRRLQLASERGGGLGLLLRPGPRDGEPSAARSRWWVTPLPSTDRSSRLRLELWRVKGGAEAVVEVVVDERTLALAAAPPLADPAARPPRPADRLAAAG